MNRSIINVKLLKLPGIKNHHEKDTIILNIEGGGGKGIMVTGHRSLYLSLQKGFKKVLYSTTQATKKIVPI